MGLYQYLAQIAFGSSALNPQTKKRPTDNQEQEPSKRRRVSQCSAALSDFTKTFDSRAIFS